MAVRFGILGAGKISRRFAAVLAESQEAELYAVAARDELRARDFAAHFDAETSYGSYAALLEDENVDAVYIGLTHDLHFRWTKAALLSGKPVLCEKPMAVSAGEAEALIALSREKQVLLMEAMWTRCLPAVRRAARWVRGGLIGPVRLIRADFCFDAPFDPTSRLYDPALCGGALLDAGVYPIEFAMGILGEHPEAVSGLALPSETGVDALDLIALRFPSGAMAHLSCAVNLALPGDAQILGENGSVLVRDFVRSTRAELYDEAGEPVATFTEDAGDGFLYEIDHFCQLLRQGALESPLVPLDDTLACAKVFDQLRIR